MPRPQWWARCRLCGWRTWDHDRDSAEHDWQVHYLSAHYEET